MYVRGGACVESASVCLYHCVWCVYWALLRIILKINFMFLQADNRDDTDIAKDIVQSKSVKNCVNFGKLN